jgi:hypothetical protein
MTGSFHLLPDKDSVSKAYHKIETTLIDLGTSKINENQARAALLEETTELSKSNNASVAKKWRHWLEQLPIPHPNPKLSSRNGRFQNLIHPGYLTFTPKNKSKNLMLQ